MFMGKPENYKLLEIVGALKAWIPKRGQPANMPRDFWMPDQSCRVCYECDSPFTVFNRRHHCRLCGRVFCAKCASNSIPVPSEVTNIGLEDGERIRVCNYCFKQQKQGIAMVDNATSMTSPGISPSPSTTSLVSSQSSCTCNSGSSVDSTVYSTGPYLHVPYGSSQSSSPSAQTSQVTVKQDQLLSSENPYSEKYGSSNRNNDEDYDYSAYRVHSNPSQFCTADVYYDDVSCNEETLACRHSQENVEMNCLSSEMLPESIERKHLGSTEKVEEIVDANNNSMEDEDPSIDSVNSTESEPVDFENNGLLWLPPEPEDEEDEREALLDDDDDNGGEGGSAGEWGYLSPSRSFADGEYRNKEKSSEEHRRVIKNIVDGHFKALIGQLLKAENLSIGDEDDKESWLEIITALSWEAATFLKPDMSQSEGMDPGAYVKVKCIPCGHFTESVVVKGVVCKKNVAHRRMTSKIDKPRLLILGGALEYQRVTNHLSSFDTLLQQEKDHLMMAVAKIDAHHPNILLVEKSVSRFAQECLLAKDISLVLNVKRPLLQRIARCTGAKIVPSVDNLATQKLGYCDSFRVEKFVEEHGKAGHDGRKLVKTLMFFEGCPKPLGCTILLKGANVDELKKVKHVVQYGVFAAYHLALETSFLADEGASLPDLTLKSPIKVALPDKPPSINKSITLIPGFTLPDDKSPQCSHTASMFSQSVAASSSNIASDCDQESYLSKGSSPKLYAGSRLDNLTLTDSTTSLGYPRFDFHDQGYEGKNKDANKNVPETSSVHNTEVVGHEDLTSNCPSNLESLGQLGGFPHFVGTSQHANMCTSELVPPETDNNHIEELEPLKEEFTNLPSDPQSILVSLSTRCVWKQSVCERSRLFRIKYYGSFDLPLGRFLRDHLFDQNYRCHSCEMPSEAHVHCYTHQQGSLTISVKKLPNVVLPGEREGKIWMWHRCMQCPRINGFPPATRRVVMSDAARGLSFGKFLELSFSNHAAASRVAGCGHSLHKDCLRFYGFGKMVACFRYAPINVHSVFLPPQKLEFNHDNQEWIHKEVNEVCSRAENLFVEVFKALHKISEQISVKDGAKAQDSGHRIAKLERILEKEKMEFEELLGKVLNGEVKADEPSVDVLEVNRLKRQLVFLAYLWDQRLVHITSPDHKDFQSLSDSAPKVKEKPFNSTDSPAERNEISCPGKGFNSSGSFLQNAKSDIAVTEDGCEQLLDGHKTMHMDQNQSHRKELYVCLSSNTNISDQSNQEPGENMKRVHSEDPVMENLSDTLDAAWTGEGQSASKDSSTPPMDSSSSIKTPAASGVSQSDDMDYQTWLMSPFLSFYQSFHKNFRNSQKQGNLSEYNPVYILSFRELLHQGGARLLLPVGVNDTVVPVYDDEPTSVISYALVSTDYHIQMSEASERTNKVESPVSLPFLDSFSLLSLSSFDEVISESLRGIGSIDESNLSSLGSQGSSSVDQNLYTNVSQARITFSDDGPRGKVKYAVTCYYAKQFEALRKACCSSELDFVRSLSRCKKWGAQGGKSNVFFAKTLDDRFIIKQVTKTELESFIKFAPAYFKYLSDAIASKSPTCLAKILGIYQVTSKHFKGGKESKMDVLVMENLLFRRSITRLYDLKGSCRSRYNPDSSGSNKVLLDQNLIESMPTSPIFLGPKAKRLLERAVWNDTAFLASIDVMDYSLLAGVDEEKHELVLGIIDFMRQYTWDKHLETWVKASGILGGPKNASPTVISPEQYKKRFRKAMSAYFLMVPDRWSSSAIVSVPSQSYSSEGNSQTGASLE